MIREPKKTWKRFVAMACVGTMLITAMPIYAEPSSSDLEKKTSDLKIQLSDIHEEIVSLSDEIHGIETKIEITEAEISRTEAELQKSKAEEEKQYDSMKQRIKYMYEEGNTSLLELITQAEDMGDFLNKTEFIQNITDYDREMLEELQAIADQVEEQETVLKAEEASLESLKLENETKQKNLKAKAKETSTDLTQTQKLLEETRQKEAAVELAKDLNTNPYKGDASELETFAAILDCEAIADYDAMLAVATVIMNRVNSSQFPNTIKGVIYSEGQFEPTWTGKLDRRLSAGASSLAKKVAKDAMGGARLSSVRYCFYFLYAPSTDRQGTEIGDNLFFVKW